MGLLLLFDVVCFDDRCFIKFGEYVDVVPGIDGRSLHGRSRISTPGSGSCIVDDRRRCVAAAVLVELINCNDEEGVVSSFAIFAHMMCMLFDAEAR